MKIIPVVVVAAALLSASCSAPASGPPEIVVDRTACSHCSMLVSDLEFAAAYRAPGQDARVFDDIGCLLDAASRETGSPLEYWFRDAAGDGWIDAAHAAFVRSSRTKTPMNGGLLAYAGAAAAERAAHANGGDVVQSTRALLASRGVSQ